MTEKDARTPDKIVVFQECGKWCAHCVDYDIAAWGPDKTTALNRLQATIELDLAESLRRTGVPFGRIGPAPDYVQAEWAARLK